MAKLDNSQAMTVLERDLDELARHCEARVMHRWGWGYMRRCARKWKVEVDGRRLCTYHANKATVAYSDDR